MTGQLFKMLLGDSTLNWAIPQSSTFTQWRSFYFNENTDNTDSCITKVSQCVAMLNYVEPQILELMKNTLSNRLYPILFPIDNLRDAITTAKGVMIKEKIDRQKTGQSSATLFMQVNDSSQPSDRTGKRGVAFEAMENSRETW